MFKAFKPEAMNKIANAMGYSGDMGQFQQYIEQDPARQARMNGFVQAAQQMAKGGMVRKMQTGGMLPDKSKTFQDRIANLQDTVNKNRMLNGINLDNTTYNVRDSERHGRMPQLTYQYGDGKTGAIRLDGAEGRQAALQYAAYTQAKKDLEKARGEFDAFQKEQEKLKKESDLTNFQEEMRQKDINFLRERGIESGADKEFFNSEEFKKFLVDNPHNAAQPAVVIEDAYGFGNGPRTATMARFYTDYLKRTEQFEKIKSRTRS